MLSLVTKSDYWYVIHTHPNQENRVSQNLTAWNITTFNPKVRERRYNQFSNKPSYVSKPLFPRYMFAKFNINRLKDIQYTRGVHSIINFGDGPVSIDDNVISLIESKIDDDGYVKFEDPIKTGDKVVIKEGPLKDLYGIFEKEIGGTDRVVILLSYVNYHCHVVVKKDYIDRSAK
jgi:transcriptional antiterminator RfaH